MAELLPAIACFALLISTSGTQGKCTSEDPPFTRPTTDSPSAAIAPSADSTEMSMCEPTRKYGRGVYRLTEMGYFANTSERPWAPIRRIEDPPTERIKKYRRACYTGNKTRLGILCRLYSIEDTGSDLIEEEPNFVEPIKNITVALGREAVLTCSVTALGRYKVGWLRAEDQTILSMHTRVVTHNSRVSVSNENGRTWRLLIRPLKEADRGCYMCQINTNVMKKQFGCIDVQVPPDIIDSETSGDVTVHEGANVSMVCKARGRPNPRITWRREDNKAILLKTPSKEMKVDQHRGCNLSLMRVERSQMGAYLCIATNDVPPAVSKRITLNVNFSPVIKVPNHVLGSPSGSNVTILCLVEAFPNTINYWLLNRTQMLLNGAKHLVEEARYSYRVTLRLTVKMFMERDAGIYSCVATNSLGKAEGSVRLYEIKIPSTTTTTTTTSTTTTTEAPTTMIDTTTVATVPPTQTTGKNRIDDSMGLESLGWAVRWERIPTKMEDPYDFQDQDDLNVVDTSSVKSGRNSRRRQQFIFANSSGPTQHRFVVGLLSILVLLRTFR